MSGSNPISGRYLLDTNTAIDVLNTKIDLEGRQLTGIAVFVNPTVLGELFFGAEKSRRVRENITQVQRLASIIPVLSCDQETAHHYGIIKHRLQQKGRPIPENDTWIAASARQHGLILVTRDRHFEYIDDLATESWQSE